jgi:AraC family transcriptional regulator, arabinose operon regulatory protein
LYFIGMDYLDMDLRLHDVNTGYCPPEWQWDNVKTGQWLGILLWLVKGGKGTLTTPELTYELARGDCLLLPLDDFYTGRHDPSDPLLIPWCRFDFVRPDGKPWIPSPDQLPPYRHLDNISFLSRLLDRCVETSAGGERERAEHWLRSTLIEIVERDRRGRSFAGTKGEQESLVDDICELVRQTPEKWYRVEELAAYMYMTPDHFIRVFKQVTGLTPGEYMIQSRIEAAKNLLRFSSHSVARIADMLGYRDVYFFSKQFRQRSGLSPSGYRRSG